jgi:hypothetical protein
LSGDAHTTRNKRGSKRSISSRRPGVAHGQQQVARWVVPICIKVIGLAASTEARGCRAHVGIAREANIPVAARRLPAQRHGDLRARCRPGSFRHITREKPRQLDELSGPSASKLLNGAAPVRWWYATQMLDRGRVKSNNLSSALDNRRAKATARLAFQPWME